MPVMLVPQIIFAGLIFKLEGASQWLSWLTISHWSMNALGATINLDKFCNDPFPCDARNLYLFTIEHLSRQWGALGLMLLVFLLATGVILKMQERRKV